VSGGLTSTPRGTGRSTGVAGNHRTCGSEGRDAFQQRGIAMIDDIDRTPIFWTESADAVVLGSKDENESDKEKYFDGDMNI
jgi:hypothetical protein